MCFEFINLSFIHTFKIFDLYVPVLRILGCRQHDIFIIKFIYVFKKNKQKKKTISTKNILNAFHRVHEK